MTFKSLGIKAAALATVTVGSVVAGATPSEAMTLFDGGVIDTATSVGSTARVLGTNLNNSATRTITGIDFAGGSASGANFTVSTATDGFSEYQGQFGNIQDISFVNNVSGPIASFFTVSANPSAPNSSDLVFDLSSALVDISGSFANVTFNGTFSNALGTILGSGEVGTVLNIRSGPSDTPGAFFLTAEAEPIPTPALLPGLMAMSAAALRKRKAGEMASTDA